MTPEILNRILAPIRTKIMHVVSRVVLSALDNTGKTLRGKFVLYGSDIYTGLDILQNYGFESMPDAADEDNIAILHSIGGSIAMGATTGIHNRKHRPKTLQAGEAVMYSKYGQSVLFKNDGSVIITPAAGQAVLLNGTGGNPIMLDTIIAKFNAHTHEYVAPLVPSGAQPGISTAANVGSGASHAFVAGTDSAPYVKAKI